MEDRSCLTPNLSIILCDLIHWYLDSLTSSTSLTTSWAPKLKSLIQISYSLPTVYYTSRLVAQDRSHSWTFLQLPDSTWANLPAPASLLSTLLPVTMERVSFLLQKASPPLGAQVPSPLGISEASSGTLYSAVSSPSPPYSFLPIEAQHLRNKYNLSASPLPLQQLPSLSFPSQLNNLEKCLFILPSYSCTSQPILIWLLPSPLS